MTKSRLLGTLSKGLTLSMKFFLGTISTSLCLFWDVTFSCPQKVLRSQVAVKIITTYAICNYHMFISNSFKHFLVMFTLSYVFRWILMSKFHLTNFKLRWCNVTLERTYLIKYQSANSPSSTQQDALQYISVTPEIVKVQVVPIKIKRQCCRWRHYADDQCQSDHLKSLKKKRSTMYSDTCCYNYCVVQFKVTYHPYLLWWYGNVM